MPTATPVTTSTTLSIHSSEPNMRKTEERNCRKEARASRRRRPNRSKTVGN